MPANQRRRTHNSQRVAPIEQTREVQNGFEDLQQVTDSHYRDIQFADDRERISLERGETLLRMLSGLPAEKAASCLLPTLG